MKSWKRDMMLSICILLFVAVTTVYAIMLKSPRIKIFLARPDTYMALWLTVLGILSLMLLLRALRNRKGEEVLVPKIWTKLGVFTVAVLFVYLLALDYLGFFLCSLFLMWSLVVMYSLNIGEVKKDYRDIKGVMIPLLVKSFVFSLAASFLTTKVFTDILSAKLPVFTLF